MKTGWEVRKFGDIVKSNVIGVIKRSQEQGLNKKYKYVKMNNITRDNCFDFSQYTNVDATEEEILKYNLRRKDFLFNTRNSHELVGKTCIFEGNADQIVLFNNNIMRVRFSEEIDPDFINYAFSAKHISEKLETLKNGTTNVSAIYYKDLKNLSFLVPPLPMQQRIVAILDVAFTAIARAKENAGKNLLNARKLFESYLQSVFANPGLGWEEKIIEKCFKVRSGDFLPARSMKREGMIDVYGGNGVTGKHDKYNLSGEHIIIGRVGEKCGNVRLVNNMIWVTDNAFYISEFYKDFDLRFLEYLLTIKDLRSTANQAAQPVISYSTIKNIRLAIPPKTEQHSIVAKLDELSAETKKLETIYQQKLDDLEELKKVILEKAFKGELSGGES